MWSCCQGRPLSVSQLASSVRFNSEIDQACPRKVYHPCIGIKSCEGRIGPDIRSSYRGEHHERLGNARRGNNLYSCSLLALDADTGKRKWHFQFTPHDVRDWDSNHVPVLAEMDIGGRRRKVVMVANRNGFFYVLDRATGEFLSGKPFTRQSWARELDAKGRPVLNPGQEASSSGPVVYPGFHGGTNWFSPSFSPRTGLFYVATRDEGTRFYVAPTPFRLGATFTGGGPSGIPGEEPAGWIQALAPATAERKWKFQMASPPWAGVLSTAGRLVFGGSNESTFFALDDETGEPLWHFQSGGWITGNPVSFLHQGKQYVVVPSGRALIGFTVDRPRDSDSSRPVSGLEYHKSARSQERLRCQ